jgi:hypothetical protein
MIFFFFRTGENTAAKREKIQAPGHVIANLIKDGRGGVAGNRYILRISPSQLQTSCARTFL